MSTEQLEAQLFYLLQKIYFDSIDNSKADEAVEAMHPEVRWVHNQVWEHDGHKSEVTDILEGRESVKEFLNNELYGQRTTLIQLLIKDNDPEFQYFADADFPETVEARYF